MVSVPNPVAFSLQVPLALRLYPSFSISRSFSPTVENQPPVNLIGVGVEEDAGSSSEILVDKQRTYIPAAEDEWCTAERCCVQCNHPTRTNVQRALIKGA